MSHTKRAIEDIQRLGWDLTNESLKKLVNKRKEDESKKRNTKQAPILKRGDESARTL
jgi:hypothetical protein